jgi:hypothetical protein
MERSAIREGRSGIALHAGYKALPIASLYPLAWSSNVVTFPAYKTEKDCRQAGGFHQ